MPEVWIAFNDSRKWGQYSYLDLLECNDVPFNYNGQELSFPSKEAQARAAAIWYSLTGMRQIGVYA